MIRILEKRNDQYLIIDHTNKCRVIKLDDYTKLKYEFFEGNRIIIKLDENNEIIETFDEGIFNIRHNSITIQTRKAVDLCTAILKYKETNDILAYEVFFKSEFSVEFRKELIDSFLSGFNRVVSIQDGYIIDDLFKIDNKGSAYTKDENGYWKYLCIVVSGKLDKKTLLIKNMSIDLDELALTIIAKILFLLNPNTSDSVFMNQLPSYIKKELKLTEKSPIGV